MLVEIGPFSLSLSWPYWTSTRIGSDKNGKSAPFAQFLPPFNWILLGFDSNGGKTSLPPFRQFYGAGVSCCANGNGSSISLRRICYRGR